MIAPALPLDYKVRGIWAASKKYGNYWLDYVGRLRPVGLRAGPAPAPAGFGGEPTASRAVSGPYNPLSRFPRRRLRRLRRSRHPGRLPGIGRTNWRLHPARTASPNRSSLPEPSVGDKVRIKGALLSGPT